MIIQVYLDELASLRQIVDHLGNLREIVLGFDDLVPVTFCFFLDFLSVPAQEPDRHAIADEVPELRIEFVDMREKLLFREYMRYAVILEELEVLARKIIRVPCLYTERECVP